MEIIVTSFYACGGKSVSGILIDSFDLFVKSAVKKESEWPLIPEVPECTQK